ncbi:MAG: TetR/AcrR family transcriptional regulator [Chloroflexi bacterium]|nr:TetR/AcrR family transcriptional regulator [Chloroflexota bacterium]MCC6895255.1 TetR/AcrR family transcriptional regulator [Anaerolineae bacterium]
MARKRNEELNAATAEAIKNAARQLMAEEGTNGLSIRGIAKVIDLTPPAIYHYFASLDELTTVLIAENFNALADALEQASAKSSAKTAGNRLFDVTLAYRQWSVENPLDFQLIYGNPIPGYVAPPEATVPAVVRTFVVAVSLMEEALHTGELVPVAPYSDVPEPARARIQELIDENGYPIAVLSMYLTLVLWTQIHGLIYLEVFNHIQHNVGDTDVFYRAQMTSMLTAMGLKTFT